MAIFCIGDEILAIFCIGESNFGHFFGKGESNLAIFCIGGCQILAIFDQFWNILCRGWGQILVFFCLWGSNFGHFFKGGVKFWPLLYRGVKTGKNVI